MASYGNLVWKPGVGFVRRGQDRADPRSVDWREEAPGWMRPQTPAGRLFDLLSRANYGMANWGLEQVKMVRDDYDDNPLTWYLRSQAAALRGLAGKDKVFWEDVLNEADVTRKWPEPVKMGVGLAGDILLDPTTYLSFGVTKAGKAGKVAAAAKGAKRLTDVGLETADLSGKALRLANKQNKLLSLITGKTGMSADDLAKAWQAGKVSQAEHGMRGLSFLGQQIASPTGYYRWAERMPLWLSDTLPAAARSGPQRWIDENVPIARKGLDQFKRAFTAGDSSHPGIAGARTGALRRANVAGAKVESLLDEMLPEVAAAARASGDPQSYLHKLYSAVEIPEGYGAKMKRLLDVRSRMSSMDALPELGGEMRRLLMVEKEILDEIATDLAAKGLDEDMARFADRIHDFFEKVADAEELIYKQRGLPYVRHQPEFGRWVPHVTTQEAIEEMGQNPALADLIPDLTLHDPSQQYRQLRMPAEYINAQTKIDMGPIFGERYAGMALTHDLIETDILKAIQTRGSRFRRVVAGDAFIENLKKSGLVQGAGDVAVRQHDVVPGRVPGEWAPFPPTAGPQDVTPLGYRTPELTDYIWGRKVSLLDGYVADAQVAREIERVWELAHKPESQRALLRIYKTGLNTWRGYALLGPSYHVRNFASNIWQNFLAGVSDPKAYADAARFQHAMKVSAKDGGAALDAFRIATPFGDMTGPQLREMLFNDDLLGGFMSEWAREVDAINSVVGATSPVGRGHRWLMNFNLGAGQQIENNARFALFFDTLQKGGSPQDAANAVRHFLFDYTNAGLSSFENETIRNLTSFYRWTKNNMLLSVEQLVKQPGKYAGIPKVKHAIEGLSEGPPEGYMPEWLAEGYAVRMPWGEPGAPQYFSLQNWLPAMQVAELFEDIDEHHVPGLSWALGMASPAITLPLEQAMNKSLFYERPIQEYPGQREEFVNIDMPPRLAHLLRPIRPLSELNKFTRGRPIGQATSQFFVGRTYPYDHQKEMRGAKFRRLERLGQLKAAWKRAVRAGDMREANRLMQLMAEVRQSPIVQ